MPGHRGGGEQRRLLLRPGARRIEDDRLEAVELGDVERAAEEIAMIDEDARAPAAFSASTASRAPSAA